MARHLNINDAVYAFVKENYGPIQYSSELATTLRQLCEKLEADLSEEDKASLPKMDDYNSIADVMYRALYDLHNAAGGEDSEPTVHEFEYYAEAGAEPDTITDCGYVSVEHFPNSSAALRWFLDAPYDVAHLPAHTTGSVNGQVYGTDGDMYPEFYRIVLHYLLDSYFRPNMEYIDDATNRLDSIGLVEDLNANDGSLVWRFTVNILD